MPLIESMSGIRGTIDNGSLNKVNIYQYITNYSQNVLKGKNKKVLLGYDGRSSGIWIKKVATKAFIENGIDVIDIGLCTTPTIAFYTLHKKASGALQVSASHNPKEWNGLKFFGNNGEILEKKFLPDLLKKATKQKTTKKGSYYKDTKALEEHIKKIISQKEVDIKSIKQKKYKILVDGINASGVKAVPKMLRTLGVSKIDIINSEIGKDFAHKPEPLKINLGKTIEKVKNGKYDIGIVVDPDADRLLLIGKDGFWISEEMTQVLAARTVLYKSKNTKKIIVTNLSASRSFEDIGKIYGAKTIYSSVGVVNVIDTMKKNKALIGGEGNGGVIWPKVHYERDSLTGIALILTYLSKNNLSLREALLDVPKYYFLKERIDLTEDFSLDKLKSVLIKKEKNVKINTQDGIKLDFPEYWIHIRKSNTEPIIRVYLESKTKQKAVEVFERYKKIIYACK